jgi:hypothetical protein
MTRIALLALAALVPATALAQAPLDIQTNVNLHLTQPSYSGCGDPAFDLIDAGDCAGLASSAIDGAAFLWVVASREGGFSGGGIGGIQFGVDYEGVDPSGWSLCTGGAEIPDGSWPASGSGNAVVWASGCYAPAGTAAVVGFFAVPNGATGTMGITTDPRIVEALWADCEATEFEICPENLGGASLASGTTPLCGNECEGGTPVDEVTWGQVKALF